MSITSDTLGAGNGAVLSSAASWRAEGRPVALATVIATWGSSPRPVGSLMAIDEGGAMSGSVSGGCIEGVVVHHAKEAMADGEPRVLNFGITDAMAWEVGLACGGKVEVYVEAVEPLGSKHDLLGALMRLRAEAVPAALVTDLTTGLKTLVTAETVQGGFGLEDHHLAEVRARIAADRSGVIEPEDEDTRLFVQVHAPPARLIIVGAVHIAQALAPLAALSGYAVTVVDPRGAFATEARFPGVTLNDAWPDDAMTALKPDARTAVVTLTHDPKLDDPGLIAALRSEAFYVGALGSTRTSAKRMERLREEGLSDAELARIHGPVGLDIGAVSPAEIAISILAQITLVRRGGPKKAKAA